MTDGFQLTKAKPRPTPEGNMVLSFRAMRLWIGALGILLPLLTGLLGPLGELCLRTSISAYYFSSDPFLHGIFIGTLVGMGFFLIAYVGYPPGRGECLTDDILCSFAGWMAIAIALFPTAKNSFSVIAGQNECEAKAVVAENATRAQWLEAFSVLHFVAAGLFLASTAVLLIWFFTRTEPQWRYDGKTGEWFFTERTKLVWWTPKFWRNVFYIVCGVMMLLCILLIGIESIALDPNTRADWAAKLFEGTWLADWIGAMASPVFFFEAVGVAALALAWLLKALASEGTTKYTTMHYDPDGRLQVDCKED